MDLAQGTLAILILKVLLAGSLYPVLRRFEDKGLVRSQPRLRRVARSVALALAALGLYGIMASAVREQTRDIGVRMALGATPARVRNDVLRRAMRVCLAGAAVGIALSLATSRVIASLLFEVSPTDPGALVGACWVLLAVAAIAAYVPASHASRVDPARALQGD